MKEYFEIGQIVNTNGLKGVLKIKPFTDDITRFNELKTVYISINKKLKEFEIETVRYAKNMVFLKLKGIDTVEEAENYRNLYIQINRENAAELEENSYYIADLIDCEVITDEQVNLGKIVDVFPTGSNDVYVVKDDMGKQVLLPAIKEVIKKVDVESKTVIVHLLKGLI